MVAVIFIGACTVAVRYISDPGFMKEIFAATGISITGLALQMMKLWKEKVNSDMVLVLAGNLSAARCSRHSRNIAQVIRTLVSVSGGTPRDSPGPRPRVFTV